MVAKHLKLLCLGLGVLGVFGIAVAAAFVGLILLTINHPWFTVPLLVIVGAYVLGSIADEEEFFRW